jgi:hypothetical protein
MYAKNAPGLLLNAYGRVYFGNNKYGSGQSEQEIIRRDVS